MLTTSAWAQLTGQVVVCSGQPEWLCYEDGSVMFTAGPGDPEDFLYRGTRESDGTRTGDQSSLLTKLINNGGNSLYVIAVQSHGGDGDSESNPWIDSDEANALDQDILDQWEGWFDTCDANDITVYFFFYDDSADVYNTSDMESAEQTFITSIVNEFEHHTHLVWVVAEEYSEDYSTTRISSIAAHIRTTDDNDHPIGVHQTNGLDFDFPSDSNIDIFMIQDNSRSASQINSDMNSAWDDAAGAWNNNLSESLSWGTGSTNRLKTWASAMGGAYVMVLGMDIDSTDTDDLADMGRVVAFFEGTDLENMAPDNSIINSDTTFALSNDPDTYIAYADSGTGNLGLTGMTSGTYDFRWFDPVDGDIVVQQDVSVTTGTNTWARPSGIGAEAAVYIGTISVNEFTPETPVITPSYETIGLEVPFSGDENSDASVAIDYRANGDSTWIPIHPAILTPDRSGGGGLDPTFFARAFWLSESTAYDFRFTYTDPDGVFGTNPVTVLDESTKTTPSPTTSTTYYLCTDGDDGNGGTDPTTDCWLTLEHAAAQLGAGDRLQVRGGTYYESDDSEVNNSYGGSSSAWIVIEPYQSESPIISGANPDFVETLDEADWTAHGSLSNIWYADVSAHSTTPPRVSYGSTKKWLVPYFEGEECVHSPSSDCVLDDLDGDESGLGEGGWHYDGDNSEGLGAGTIFVKIPDGVGGWEDPNTIPVYVPRVKELLLINESDFVSVQNMEMEHAYSLIKMSESSEIYTTGNVIRHGVYPWEVRDTSAPNDDTFNVLSDNDEIYDNGMTDIGTKEACTDEDHVDACVWHWVKQHTEVERQCFKVVDAGDGVVVRDAYCHSVFNGGIWEDHDDTPLVGVEIYDSRFVDIMDDGFEPEGELANSAIWNNRIEGPLAGISGAPVNVGPLFVMYNEVVDHWIRSLKMNHGYGSSVGFGPWRVYHNTFITRQEPAQNPDEGWDDSDGWRVPGFDGGMHVISRNNHYQGTDRIFDNTITVGESAGKDLDWDYDNGWIDCRTDSYYENGGSDRFIKWSNVAYSSWSAFQSGESQEANGTNLDPVFFDADCATAAEDVDLTPDTGSNLIDAGIVIEGINDIGPFVYEGSAPDIGANESALCGNNVIDSGEVCDGTALSSNTCSSLSSGLANGTLTCNDDCGVSCGGTSPALCGYDIRACLDDETGHPPDEPYDPETLLHSLLAENDGSSFTFAALGECKGGCDSTKGVAALDEFRSGGREHGTPDMMFSVGDDVAYTSPDWDDLVDNVADVHRAYPFFLGAGDQDCKGDDGDCIDMYDQYCIDHPGCDDVLWFDVGSWRFFLSGYNTTSGHEETDDAAVKMLDETISTVGAVLDDMVANGKQGIWVGHHQWLIHDNASGRKSYCDSDEGDYYSCTSSDLLTEFNTDDVVLVLQGDNHGYSRVEDGGTTYLKIGALKGDGSWDEDCASADGYQNGDYPCVGSCQSPCDGFYLRATVTDDSLFVEMVESGSGGVFDSMTLGSEAPAETVVVSGATVSGGTIN